MTDTEKSALCARIDELCAEVERLRQENQSIGMAAYELGRASLADEADKLRELVRDMWNDGMCDCDERGACAQCEYHFPDRMRELGVDG